jgi:hypothetical protein
MNNTEPPPQPQGGVPRASSSDRLEGPHLLDESSLDTLRDIAKRLNVDAASLVKRARMGHYRIGEQEEDTDDDEDVEDEDKEDDDDKGEGYGRADGDLNDESFSSGNGSESYLPRNTSGPQENSVQSFLSPEEQQPLITDPTSRSTRTRESSVGRSSHSFGGSSQNSKKLKAKKKGRVRFMTNVIKEVHVYEVDRTLHIDISYTRNKIGWVALVLLLAIGTSWGTYGIWLSAAHKPKISLAILGLWVSMIKLPCYWLAVIAMMISGGISLADFKALKQPRVLGATIALAVTATFGVLLVVASSLISKNQVPAFSPTVNLGLIWVMGYRWMRNKPTFMIEWVGAAVAVVGYTLASWSQFDSFASVGEIFGANAVLLVCSVSLAIWLLLIEYCQHASPSILVTYFPNSLTDLVFFFLVALAYEGPEKIAQASSWELFDLDNFPSGLIIALGGLSEMLLDLTAARYLDVLSILATFALKIILIPYGSYVFVYAGWTEAEKRDKGVVFDIFLWLGTPMVVIGCLLICIFSSVKRDFVARRLTLSPASLRRVSDPYVRKSDATPSKSTLKSA